MNAVAKRNGEQRSQTPNELAKLFDRLPPHSLTAESALLGSMILDWRVCGDVIEQLGKSADAAFFKPSHAAIYAALIKCYDTNQSIDMVQLTNALGDRLEQVGGVDYLIALAESVPSATSAKHYARLTKDKATLRQLIDVSGKILYNAYHKEDSASDQLDAAESSIMHVADVSVTGESKSIGTLMQDRYAELEDSDGRPVTGIETGYFDLDDAMCGLHDGHMTIIAARPSQGKTALMLNIAEHVGASNHVPVAVFSMEMTCGEIANRLMCSRGGIDSHKLRRNMISGDEFQHLSLIVGELQEAPIQVDDTAAMTLLQLRAKARRMVSRYKVRAIFIDYLQLMVHPGAENRQVEVSTISKGIKALAKELKLPIVVLAQLNRASESREGHRPRMSDLRESGSIEQDADDVLLLHREEYFHQGDQKWIDDNPDLIGVADLIIAKQRNGPTGVIKLQWNGPATRFNNLQSRQGGLMQ